MKYGCKGKEAILDRLNYMVIYAPSFREPYMTLDLAFATVEYGFKQIEEKDGRPEIMEGIEHARRELSHARELFDQGEEVPACHKLQDVEDIIQPLKVKPEVR